MTLCPRTRAGAKILRQTPPGTKSPSQKNQKKKPRKKGDPKKDVLKHEKVVLKLENNVLN